MKIGLISDTHSFLDPQVFKAFEECDEVWHAGDFGTLQVAEELESFRPFRGVYGNIDHDEIRERYPLDLHFECEGVKVWITHIAGHPRRYDRRVKRLLSTNDHPDLIICGHSHILRIDTDEQHSSLKCINPGAAGHHGFHKVRTLLKMELVDGALGKMSVVELGPRGRPNK